MAYYLTVKEGINHKLLDITKLQEFKRISKFKENSYSLEEIDLFTTQFDSEIDLKTKLFQNNIITLEDLTKNIEIRMKYNGKLEKVTYDLFYKPNQKFLQIDYLEKIFLTLQDDKTFLKKILNRYIEKRDTKEQLLSIKAILDSIKEHGYNIYDDINIYKELNDFFENTLYDRRGKLKYKSLHDLAMFIYNYLVRKNLNSLEYQLMERNKKEELQKLKESLTPKTEKVDLKIRVRKTKYTLDEQESFF